MHAHSDIDARLKKRLFVAVILTSCVFVAELVGGLVSNSLALISDSMHVLMDAVALTLSLLAIYVASLPPTDRRTYGYHRVEVFAAFINGSTIAVIAAIILYKAYFRFLSPEPVESTSMLVVAVAGLIVNVGVAYWLHGFAKSDLNVKSAFFHVLGDAAASIGVIAGAIGIRYTGALWIDPAISVFIGIIILAGAARIIREAAHILLEGVPADIDLKRVVESISEVKGVNGVHSLHVWSICHNVNALSAHVQITDFGAVDRRLIIKELNEKLAQNFHIFYTTIQMECSGCGTNDVLRKFVHRARD